MRQIGILLLVCVISLMASCKDKPKEPEVMLQDEGYMETTGEALEEVIELSLMNTEGLEVGMAKIEEDGDGVHLTIEGHHLQPGLHGFHIHEKGLCEGPSFETAGGHFNPTDQMHGFDHPDGPHAGDLPNIEVKEDGTVQAQVTNRLVTLKKGEVHSLRQEAGTSLMIHALADDYYSQPAGNAGDRIVCGVIAAPEGAETDEEKKKE